MRTVNLIIFSILLCAGSSFAQSNTEKLTELSNYVKGLKCHQEASSLAKSINNAYLESRIKEARSLSKKRTQLLLQAVDSLFTKESNAAKSSEAAQIVYGLSSYLDCDILDNILSRFNGDFSTEQLKKMREDVAKDKAVSIGMKAIDFKLNDSKGKKYSFSSFKGKYIFLEFSASWCSWCKKEIPFIEAAYKKYNKEVVFITVFLDDNRDKWINDMEKHKFDWLGLSDLMAWESPIAQAYNIQGVPNCYLLDKDRVIVGRGMRGAEVEETIEDVLLLSNKNRD